MKKPLFLPLILSLFLLPSLPTSAQQSPTSTPPPSVQPSEPSKLTLPETLQLLSQKGYLVLLPSQLQSQIQKAVDDATAKAVQVTVAEWKPKFDADELKVKELDLEKWKWGGYGIIIGAATLATILVITRK